MAVVLLRLTCYLFALFVQQQANIYTDTEFYVGLSVIAELLVISVKNVALKTDTHAIGLENVPRQILNLPDCLLFAGKFTKD